MPGENIKVCQKKFSALSGYRVYSRKNIIFFIKLISRHPVDTIPKTLYRVSTFEQKSIKK